MTATNVELQLKDNTRTLCIHFSSRNKPIGKYDRYPVPKNVSNIYVNTGDKSWYLNGLVSLGESLEDSISYFRNLISEKSYAKIICIGSSMGAFGAALFSSKLDAECICFGPELYLNVFGGFSKQDNVTPSSNFKLDQPSRCLLISGIGCPSDVLISIYYSNHWTNCSTIILRNTGHETARNLKQGGALVPLIENFILGDSLSKYDSVPIDELQTMFKVSSLQNIDISTIEYFCKITNKWVNSYQMLKMAEHFTNRKIYSVARNILNTFIEKHGPLTEAIFLQAKLFRRMRLNNQALESFKALEFNPEYRLQGLWGQSMIQTKLGNEIEAQRLYRLIIKGSSELPIVKESLRLSKQSSDPETIEAPRPNLILTTFPGHKSRNVGDSMITYSAKELLCSRNNSFKSFTLFREKNLDKYRDGSIKRIIAPGFSVSNDVYPSLYGLYTNLSRLPEFYPIGCSFQHSIASKESFDNYIYTKETLEFLKLIENRSGKIHCRDQLIVDLLLRNDIPAIYSGDLVLFDNRYIHEPFFPPNSIESVVFTIQHHQKYNRQSFKVLSLIRDIFLNARKYVSFHSNVNAHSQEVADFASNLGFNILHLYGEATNLDIYDDMDLHIGYRLHGHISFLRRRKPSILLVEDARSFGFSRTAGTKIGCFDALDQSRFISNEEIHNNIGYFLSSQLENNFCDYQRIFDFIDKTYHEVIDPFFNKLL